MMHDETPKYDPSVIEPKWQRYWDEERTFEVTEDSTRPKYYLLEMFPYPSGRIHMGHMRNYSIGDVVTHYKRMRGYNVIHPMGWDSFGLPAENAAIQEGAHPAKWTSENIDYMRSQLKRMGFSYAWDREISTCDPQYYRWEQEFFLKMFERGLAYRETSVVNYCPGCQTVLANEQNEGGYCWRCKSPVQEREQEGWFLRISDYADELLDWLDKLNGWPERVLTMQRNWIGKSEGAEINFPLEEGGHITVFTTRQDTVFGATFMSLAPEHPLVKRLIKGRGEEKEVLNFVERVMREDQTIRISEGYTKEGVFTGAYCTNPFTNLRMPLFVANFVLMEYGTGAVMAVPAHDTRDFAFARKYNIPIVVVVRPPGEELDPDKMDDAYVDEGIMINSGPYNGLKSEEFRKVITGVLEREGKGRAALNYRLRDWGVSRQRYWGAPIPMIHCSRCGVVPVPREDLPVILPLDVKGAGGSPLERYTPFVEVACPSCKGPARRETDTFDTFVESSWYFIKYASPHSGDTALEGDKVKYWLPVDQYIGGIEHAVLHLLYARFFTKVLRDLGYHEFDEPFLNLLTQGMVIKDGAKMSKSRGNVVDPDELIENYGADTSRLFCLFAAPPEKDLDWSDKGVEGCNRFLNRLWRLFHQQRDYLLPENDIPSRLSVDDLPGDLKQLYRRINHTIKKVTEDIEDEFHLNTAISALMEMYNSLNQFKAQSSKLKAQGSKEEEEVISLCWRGILLLLAPFAPHIADELWERAGYSPSILTKEWPTFDEDALKKDSLLIVVQVNGRVRSRITLPAGSTKEEIMEASLEDARVKKWIEGKEIDRVVVVKDKLVNVVVK